MSGCVLRTRRAAAFERDTSIFVPDTRKVIKHARLWTAVYDCSHNCILQAVHVSQPSRTNPGEEAWCTVVTALSRGEMNITSERLLYARYHEVCVSVGSFKDS
jgi:hypothetical protein